MRRVDRAPEEALHTGAQRRRVEEEAQSRRGAARFFPDLKARVRAIPEAGRANAALEMLIARWLGVPPSTVSVAHGGKSRLKQVAVAGDAEALSCLVAQRVAALAGKR